MNIKKFLHFHLATDHRSFEIIHLISKKDFNNKTELLLKEVSTSIKNRWIQYIPWLINNTNQTSEEMADSIFKDMIDYS